jgi:cytochrome c oxidase assembly factor CtaG
VILAAALVFGLVCARGWVRLRASATEALPAWRLVVVLGGLAALWLAIGSPLAELDHASLTAHMLKHLLLMTVAAPLILLGVPSSVVRRGLPSAIGDALEWWRHSAPVRRLGRFVGNPAVCWLAGTLVVLLWHVPAVLELGMRSHRWHGFQDISFFAAGLLFWRPVVQSGPDIGRASRWLPPVYLFLATFPCDALSAFLVFCGRVVYPPLLEARRPFAVSALADQECAGALMWIWVTLVYLVPAVVITGRNLSPARATAGRPDRAAEIALATADRSER